MDELIARFIDFCNNNPGVMVFGAVTLVEIVPIKINPWSGILKWIGKVVNAEDRKNIADISVKIDNMRENQTRIEETVAEMKHEIEEDKAKEKRWHILDFVNSCRHGRTHTREEWNHVISELADYETFTERKGIKNGVIEEDAKYLRKLFQQNNDTNNFL